MKVFGITGWKNSGKTSLVEKLVSHISGLGYRVSTIKHAHHEFDVDHEGTDSFRHRQAGAEEVLIASSYRWALMHELRNSPEPTLEQLTGQLAQVDLVIIEGFKNEEHAKIQVVRPSNNAEPMAANIGPMVAIATDDPSLEPSQYHCDGPRLDLNDTQQIADLILDYCGLDQATNP